MKSMRFGPDYIRDDKKVEPESSADGVDVFYAELTNEQKAWNAQWYAEDHNQARQEQRRFFLRYLQHNFSNMTQSLYQVLPAYRRIFADHGADAAYSRFSFLQSVVMSFNNDYLAVSEARRKEVDGLIEEVITKLLESKPEVRNSPASDEADASEWQSAIIQMIPFKALERLRPHEEEETEDTIDERFAIVYRPLYAWLAKWHLLEPWAADIALSTLCSWDLRSTEQPKATSLIFEPRPKSAQHNVFTYSFPRLAAEDLHFSFSFGDDWDLESQRFTLFQEAFTQAAQKALGDFKQKIDEKMLQAGYVQVTGNTNVHQLLPFRYLALYHTGGLSFTQITQKELEREGNLPQTEDEHEKFSDKFEKLQAKIEKATYRLAKRIGLKLRGTNRK